MNAGGLRTVFEEEAGMIRIFTGAQIREADRYTMRHEPIGSWELMERASLKIAEWLGDHTGPGRPYFFVVGKGNNGGDGLAVARMLAVGGSDVTVALLFGPEESSDDNRRNRELLPTEVRVVDWSGDGFPGAETLSPETVIVDAVLGSGVKGPVTGRVERAVDFINAAGCEVVSIDLPSGLGTEFGNAGRKAVKAGTTLALEFPKLSELLPEAGDHTGRLVILPFGLSPAYKADAFTPYRYVTCRDIDSLLKKRAAFSHKGTYGHLLLVCGSRGMAGAALLSAQGALRSGCGLVTVHLPAGERLTVQTAAPQALISGDPAPYFSEVSFDPEKFTTVGAGCGLGQAPATLEALKELLARTERPMLLDADALNLLADHPALQNSVPAGSVLTPHPGEFRRLVGPWADEEDKFRRLRELAARLKVHVVLKGAYTALCVPEGTVYFNPTGNPGMAKGGSGDVLSGLIAGLMARGYRPFEAALLGVWFHGLAGDRAAALYGEESVTVTALIDNLIIRPCGDSE